MTLYLILAYSAFLLTLLGTRVIILASRKRISLLDRHGHPKRPIPSNGGVVVVMALIICLLIADINYGIILSMFMLAAISLLGDIIRIPGPVRLLVQMLAVLIPVSIMHGLIFGGAIPLWADKIITVILWVWFINLFNLMDGVDGMAPTEIICIAAGMALVMAINSAPFPNPLSVYCLIIMSAGCGFFWWNWQPAKILLGEVGSVPIGFLLGYLFYVAIINGYGYAAAILPAYYLSDATITLGRRIYQGKSISEHHYEHYYQLAVRNGRQHGSVVRYIFGVNLLLVLFAVFAVIYKELAIYYLAIAYMCTFIMLGFFAHAPHNPRHEPF